MIDEKFSVRIVYSQARRSTATLSYTGNNHFELRVPYSASEKWIAEFLKKRRRWMEKAHTEALLRRQRQTISPGCSVITEFYSLKIEQDPSLRFPQYRAVPGGDKTVFYLAPEFFAPEKALVIYEHLEKYLLVRLQQKAGDKLIARGWYWAEKHDIAVREFFVRVQKSRLGYCTHDRRIMLNARLLLVPEKVRDYVIHHELAHTRHRNHSRAFWDYLETLFAGARAFDKTLNDPTLFRMQVVHDSISGD